MNRSGVVGGLVLALVVTTPQGCDDPPREVPLGEAAQSVADVYCGRMFACDCEGGRRFDSHGACEIDIGERVDDLRRAGEEAGLFYDPTCLGSFLDLVEETACGPTLYDFSECSPGCLPYYGLRHLGESCEFFPAGLSDCDRGLRCIGGICQNPCDSGAHEGESCAEQPCRDGLYCHPNEVCFVIPDVGEPCPYSECAPGAFCGVVDPADPAGLRQCFALAGLGGACAGHLECASSYCPQGRCEERPTRGRPCPAEVCAPGLSCVDRVCVDAEPAICFAGTPI
jgi:hypothetical protein